MGKRHYENLLEYFKYLVTLTTIFLGIIVGVLLYATYENGNDMKEDMEKKAKELREDFDERTRRMDAEMNRVRLDADQTVKNTKDAALIEIDQVKNVAKATATSEAKEQIELVFQKNNIDSFIVNTAKKHIEPLVLNVNEKQKIIEIDSAINKIQSGNFMKMQEGANILVSDANAGHKLLEKQQTELIKIIKNLDTDSELKSKLIDILLFQNSEIATTFFEYLLLNENDDLMITNQAINFLIKNDMHPNYKLFSEAIEKKPRDIFGIFIQQAMRINRNIILPFLNSPEVVNVLNRTLKADEIEYLQVRAESDLLQYFTKEQINNTLFFQKIK